MVSPIRENADRRPARQSVVHEIHGPDLVDLEGLRRLRSSDGRPVSPRPLDTQTEPFFSVKSINTFPVDGPSFASEERVDQWVARSCPHGSDFPNPLPERVLVRPDAAVPNRRAL